MAQMDTSLCQTMNSVRLLLYYYGRANISTSWEGEVYNPGYSRLFYIVSGRARIQVKGQAPFFMEKGNWYLLPAGCSFEYSCDDWMDHVYFRLQLCGIDGIDLFRKCPRPCSVALTDNKEAFFINSLSSSTFNEGLKIRQELYRILVAMIEQNDLNLHGKLLSACVTRAVKFIQGNLSVQLTSQTIADHAGVSVSTLTKRFKSELSASIHDYIYDLVLFEAEQLLIRSDMSVADISDNFGFCDQFYFSRRFKDKFNMSPREYRKTFML